MKHILPFLLLIAPLLLFSQKPVLDTIRQYTHAGDKMQPTDKEVLVKIAVLDFGRAKVPGLDVRAVDEKAGRVWQGVTGKFGEVYFLLPKGRDYRIDVGDQEGLKSVSLPNKRGEKVAYTLTYAATGFHEETRNDTIFQRVSAAQMPTRERVLVHLKTLDLDNRPLDGEVLWFAAKKTGKVYVAEANHTGDAWLMLPQGDTYCISTRFDADMQCFDIPKVDMAGKLNITCNTIGTQNILRRKAERARQAAIRDSLYQLQRIQDSLVTLAWNKKMLKQDSNYLHMLEFGVPPEVVQKQVEKQAAAERDSMALDSMFFQKALDDVKAPLYRNRMAWSHKTIVTDMTCSMSPYIDQVLLWHALQLVQGEANRYVFFNDGDGKTQEQKIAGQTGGFHYTEKPDMQQLLKTMQETTSFGCSGDGPENDLEALLEGVKKRSGVDELVLIADNYSDVRDIELLTRLRVPVHIILCGTEFGINEDYLEIAFKTGGSIHTIEQDIRDLTRMADGETIIIGLHQYRVCRGKFIKVDKI